MVILRVYQYPHVSRQSCAEAAWRLSKWEYATRLVLRESHVISGVRLNAESASASSLSVRATVSNILPPRQCLTTEQQYMYVLIITSSQKNLFNDAPQESPTAIGQLLRYIGGYTQPSGRGLLYVL